MWIVATVVLATLLLASLIWAFINSRRNAEHVRVVTDLLRANDDDRAAPATLDQGLRRLRTVLDSDGGDAPLDQLLAAFDEVPVGAVIANADGTVIARNRVAAPFESARHGDALAEAAVQSRMRDALVGHGTDEELRLHGPPERMLHIVGSPLIVNGELIGAIVLIDDVSEQHRLAAVRRDFVANVSHELRTPVGALSLLAETLVGENDPEILQRFLLRIQNEASRLSNLIDDLLDLSRIERGVGPEPAPVALSSVVREAFGAVRELANHKGVNASLQIGEEEATALGDHSQLVSAVTNLFENAVKYSSEGDSVIGRLVVHGDEAAVAIVDTGIGIPAPDLNRIFERFYRVDRGRSSTSGGTGLGLSIVRHVAVNHGGRVEVVSHEGEGSTFTLILPLEVDNESRRSIRDRQVS